MTTDNTKSPIWVHRLGTACTSLTVTTLLFYIVLALRIPWLLAGEWEIVDIGRQLDVWLIVSILIAVLFVPLAFGVFAGLRRIGIRTRYAWAGAAVASVIVVLAWAISTADPSSGTRPATTSEIVAIPILLVLFSGIIVAGTWAGRRLTRIDTPLQNRRLLVAGAVLVALVAAPTAIAAVADDPEPGAYGPEVEGQYDDGLDDSDSGGDDSSQEDSSDDSPAGEPTALGELRCEEPLDDAPAEPNVSYVVAGEQSLPDNTTVWVVEYSDDSYSYHFEVWNDMRVVNAEAVNATGASGSWDDPGVFYYSDFVEFGAPGSTDGRMWVDAVNDNGEVVRYELDLCAPPEE